MGGTCSPAQDEENVDNERAVQPSLERNDSSPGENLAKLINDYQAENENLKSKLEEAKSRNQEGITEAEEKKRQNEEVMKELAQMKEMLEAKDQALVKSRLEAALRSKATTMRSFESKTRLCLEGFLKYHHRSGLTKSKKMKHVEVHLKEGELLTNEYKAGFVMLTYADSKGASTAKRCEVMDVSVDESKSKEITFAVNVSVEGSFKELMFSIDTEEDRDEWVKCIRNALDEIQSAYRDMNEEFTLKLEISKEKMGIKVEEIVVDQSDIEFDEKAKEAADKVEGTMTKAAREVEIEQKKKENAPQEEIKELEEQNIKEIAKEEQLEEQKLAEKPCELIVTSITDEDLIKAGLVPKCVLRAINDTALVGMVYSDQIELLQNTPKPYTITFTGKNLLKKKGAPTHAYVSILKELVADGENAVKSAFHELVKGTPFESDLKSSNDQVATITELLADQRKLLALLKNLPVQSSEL